MINISSRDSVGGHMTVQKPILDLFLPKLNELKRCV